MIGRIIGAVAGNKAAEHLRGINGTTGTLLGIAAPTVLRRMGPLGLIAAVAGGYAYKKFAERREADMARAKKPDDAVHPTRTQA